MTRMGTTAAAENVSSQPPDAHALTIDQTLAAQSAGNEGLSAAEAARRRAIHGANRLPPPPRHGPWRRMFLQFHNVLIYVLLAAAVIAFAIGEIVEALVILAVVALNAVIGFIQEGRAEQALQAIQSLLSARAAVMRDGHRITLAAEDVVPGDIVFIEAGDRVPADLRLVRARGLRIDEAALTGESMPVEKNTAPVATEAALGDRSCMAYSGTYISTGQGMGVAVATGLVTELGRISTLVGTVQTLRTPLTRQMDTFARQLTIFILAAAAALFVFARLFRDYDPTEIFMAIVGLVVAAIPEGLPAVMTIALAIGVQRMAHRNAIIRRLPAVETLGSVSVICSDKTGTLTANEMTVRSVVTTGGRSEVSGVGYEPHGAFRAAGENVESAPAPLLIELARAALLCNDAALRRDGERWTVHGDPMEGALISLAIKAGLDPATERRQVLRRDEIPFDAAHRFMATLHHSHEGAAFACIKGAPERILGMCTQQRTPAGDVLLDRAYWERQTASLAGDGERVLALAVKAMQPDGSLLTFENVREGATLLGLVGLADPPREEARQAIAECRGAGITVKMITGDHAVTAAAIARQIGLAATPRVLTGHELDALDEQRLPHVAREVDVFARTSPEHKLRLVTALQAGEAVVAMTGDGVNDAPALKRADIGVAMGRKGTEVAKEAAHMVLADDNFASIVAAVREGRTAYDNLRKVIGWVLPTNGGVSLIIIAAMLFGLTLPVSAVQILWINLVTTVALALTLAFEPTEPGTMRRPPRPPREPLLPPVLAWRIVFVSLLFLAGASAVFFWALRRNLPVETARTMVVNTIVVMEIFYLFSVRYVYGTSLTWRGALGTPAVLGGVAMTVVAQLLFTYAPPLQRVFETRPVALPDGVVIVGIGVALLIAVEIEKVVQRRLERR
jgi:magnesium-transporting ATPase (P-type)